MKKCEYPNCEKEAKYGWEDVVKDRDIYSNQKYKSKDRLVCEKHIRDKWIIAYKVRRFVWMCLVVMSAILYLPIYLINEVRKDLLDKKRSVIVGEKHELD